MKKPWSISTTVRNPERIRDFLGILKKIEGEKWTKTIQKKFQVMLIQYKIYGYGSIQFYNGLLNEHSELMKNSEPITYSKAEEILDSKNYIGGGDMRGRQSFNPLEKMGLAFLDKNNKIKISAVGNYFLETNYDLGEVFFKSFLKWQLPNPDSIKFKEKDGFNIRPFIGTLYLIYKVNEKWHKLRNKPVGISKKEFSLFVPTLINYKKIEKTAQTIIDLRLQLKKQGDKKKFFKKFSLDYIKKKLDSNNLELIKATLKKSREYTDNIIRYFRLTKYIYIRGGGFYIDLEPRREFEINSLLKINSSKALKFKNRTEYIKYLSDINQPILLWETKPNLIEIVKKIINEIDKLETSLGITKFKEKNYIQFNIKSLKLYVQELRDIRRILQENINYQKSQDLTKVKEYIKILKDKIYSMKKNPTILEKYITLALNALNDAIRIKPNYPVGDDNEPTNTAPARVPDIEGYYKKYNLICEVTMLQSRSQWYNEGQPVMRHLRDFEDKNTEKEVYCLFIAPIIHQDTLNTFWNSVKHNYQGKKQNIIPFTIKQFVELLEVFLKIKKQGKQFTHLQLVELYNNILDLNEIDSSIIWNELIPSKINDWKREILA